MIHNGEVSARQVTESALERIAAIDGTPPRLETSLEIGQEIDKVHAFITITAERALQRADEIDRQLANGDDPGPLAGVPFSVKDLFCTRGVLTSAGSRILSNFIAPYTATPVARLEAAGGSMLGKVNWTSLPTAHRRSSAYQPCHAIHGTKPSRTGDPQAKPARLLLVKAPYP